MCNDLPVRRCRQDSVHEAYAESCLGLRSHREKDIVKFDADFFFRLQPPECQDHMKSPCVWQHALESRWGTHTHAVTLYLPVSECQIPGIDSLLSAPYLQVGGWMGEG